MAQQRKKMDRQWKDFGNTRSASRANVTEGQVEWNQLFHRLNRIHSCLALHFAHVNGYAGYEAMGLGD
jgi:hypothetical protein